MRAIPVNSLAPTQHEANNEHVLPVAVYVRAFAALLVLLVVTLAAARLPLGTAANSLVALAVAAAKAVIVIFYFMHVRFSSRLVQIWAAAGFVWLVIMFGITLADYVVRSWAPVPGWE